LKKKRYWTPEKHTMTSCQINSLFGTSSLSDFGRVTEPSEEISVAEVKAAITKMKTNKDAGLIWGCFRNVESVRGGQSRVVG